MGQGRKQRARTSHRCVIKKSETAYAEWLTSLLDTFSPFDLLLFVACQFQSGDIFMSC